MHVSLRNDCCGFSATGAIGFSVGSKGYVGTGSSDGSLNYNTNDFWEYDPSLNTWPKKTAYPGGEVQDAAAFATYTKGYIGMGAYLYGTTHFYSSFYEYDPSAESWSQIASFPSTARANAVGFAIGNNGYVGTGFDGQYVTK